MKINHYPHTTDTQEMDLEGLAAFFKNLLELRAKGNVAEIEKILTFNPEDPGFRDVWTNPVGKDRRMFTLTGMGVFRCWARPFDHFYPKTDGGHFDAAGSDSLLFEVKYLDDYHVIEEWVKTHFVAKMLSWHCDSKDDRGGNTVWMGRPVTW